MPRHPEPPHPSTSVAAEPAIITFAPGSVLGNLSQTAANRMSITSTSPSTVSVTATATPTSLGKFFGLDMPTWAPVAIAATVIGLCMIIVCVTCRRCLRIVCCFGCPCKCRRQKKRGKRGQKRKGPGSDSSYLDEEEAKEERKGGSKKKTSNSWRGQAKGSSSSSLSSGNQPSRIVYTGSGGASDVEAYLLSHGQLYKVETPSPQPLVSASQPLLVMSFTVNGGSSALNASGTLWTGALLNQSKSNKHAPKVQSPLAMAPVLRASSTSSMGSPHGSTQGSLHSHPSLGATMVVQEGQITESIEFVGHQQLQRIGSGRLLVAGASAKSLRKGGRGSRGGHHERSTNSPQARDECETSECLC